MNMYGTRDCSLLVNLNFTKSIFKKVNKAPMIMKRKYASLCSLGDKLIFASGGMRQKSVECYDMAQDQWKMYP